MGNMCLKDDTKKGSEKKQLKTEKKKDEKPSSVSNSQPNQREEKKIQQKIENSIPATTVDKNQEPTQIKKKDQVETVPKISQKQNQNKHHQKKQPTDEIEAIYMEICGQEQIMNDEKLFEFLGDRLGIKDDDIVSGHIITNIMKLTRIQKTSLQNFRKLFNHCNSKTIEEIKNKLPSLKKELQNKQTFQNMYLSLFVIYTGDHTTLDLETAGQLWNVYLRGKLTWLRKLQQYIERRDDKETMKVHKDLWKMMLSFSLEVKNVDTDYKEDDFWPTFIENFVEYLKEGK